MTTRCTVPWNTTGSDPSFAIRPGVAPGECWAFQGKGNLVIRLAYSVNITGCSLEHIPSVLHPNGRASSAPKSFQLWVSCLDLNSVLPSNSPCLLAMKHVYFKKLVNKQFTQSCTEHSASS